MYNVLQSLYHQCSFCERKYTRKDHLKEHVRKKHNIVLADRTKTFFCPFKFDSGPFRMSGDLLQHCDMSLDDNLGIIEETIYH